MVANNSLKIFWIRVIRKLFFPRVGGALDRGRMRESVAREGRGNLAMKLYLLLSALSLSLLSEILFCSVLVIQSHLLLASYIIVR